MPKQYVCDAVGLRTTAGYFKPTPKDWKRLKNEKLKEKLIEEGGLTTGRPFLESSLTYLNDCGFTFAEIAEIIRWKPNGLFKKKQRR